MYSEVSNNQTVWNKRTSKVFFKNQINAQRCHMVFCFQNCCDSMKKSSSDREKVLIFKAEGQVFAKVLRSLEQFI